MFPSTLLVSSSPKKLAQKIKSICQKKDNPFDSNNPDIFQIGDGNWTIADVRFVKNFFSKKPFSHSNKIAIIHQADKLGIPAQNALLKTLEEPGKNNFLILTTSKPQAQLPTILSRCQPIHLHSLKPTANRPHAPNSLIPLSSDPVKNLTTADKLGADKDGILPLIKRELSIQQNLLIDHPLSNTTAKIERLIHAIRLIGHNVDPRSALDYYLLSP